MQVGEQAHDFATIYNSKFDKPLVGYEATEQRNVHSHLLSSNRSREDVYRNDVPADPR